jgi:hypothetical protein
MERTTLTTTRTQAIEPDVSPLRSARELSVNAAFIDRVTVAAVEAAINVTSEERTTSNHANRGSLARKVLMSPRRWGELMALAVAVNGTINQKYATGEEIPDGDVSFVVASLWDSYAGSDSEGVEDSAEAQRVP